MKLLLCRCTQCKAARKEQRSQERIIAAKRAARRTVKHHIRLGRFDTLATSVYVGYLG